MKVLDILTIVCIGVGASIMFFAALKTAELRKLTALSNDIRWLWLGRFMVIFLIGYVATIMLIVLGIEKPLLLLIGLVFLLGAYFVYIVVSSARSDLLKINDSNSLLAQKNEELKKINQELDQFAYRTSHDLKAPISSLKGLINIVTFSNDPNEIHSIHNMMSDRLVSLENLIRDILDLSKNSRTELQKSSTSLHQMMEQILTEQRHSANESIQVSIDGDPDLEVMIDSTRLKMVLGNLISNALQYSDFKKLNPYIKIHYWCEDGALVIVIKDNGRGIDKQYQHKIFDMFFRAENTTQGSGLGLYIVKETTQKMGGEIKLISEKGVGSEFVVTVPAEITEKSEVV